MRMRSNFVITPHVRRIRQALTIADPQILLCATSSAHKQPV